MFKILWKYLIFDKLKVTFTEMLVIECEENLARKKNEFWIKWGRDRAIGLKTHIQNDRKWFKGSFPHSNVPFEKSIKSKIYIY